MQQGKITDKLGLADFCSSCWIYYAPNLLFFIITPRAHIVEAPIIFESRHAGLSKMSGSIAREAFWQVIRVAFRGRGHGKPVPR
jgi:hypothetical protein